MIAKGDKINERYQVIRTIGEGGMANVYLAHDTILDRDVAVKILRGDLANDEKFVRRFQREAISASSLTHPNIVEMYDVGEDDGKYFIVMEYVEGKTLKSLIKKRGALTLPEVIDIMLQLTNGIACAHDSYIIHRDIKPQNVLILDDGRVKITDFGIAMAMNNHELTQTNSVMGSVHYLPPEQANGNGSTIKSDIYSLGILMYELLTGKLPFKGDNAVEIAIKQMKEPIPSVRKENQDIPQSIENIILKACAKNPKNRYENVGEMHEDIRTCLNQERDNEKRITYVYPEQELEDTKAIPNLSRFNSKRENRKEEEAGNIIEGEEKEPKKGKVTMIVLIVTGVILFFLAIILSIGMMKVFLPNMTKVPDVRIPDVSTLTVIEAEDALKKEGFVVAVEIIEESSDTIEKDKVIRTEPQSGRSVKKGFTIQLVVSSGKSGIVLENYVGKNYYEIKAQLENKGIIVLEEKKDVTKEDKVKENSIMAQDKKAGTKLVKGDTITLTIPNLITQYPDFVAENYSLADVEKFCKENGILLEVEKRQTNESPEGKILYQDRGAGTPVRKNVTLKIVVAEKIPEPVEPEVPENPSDENDPSKPEE